VSLLHSIPQAVEGGYTDSDMTRSYTKVLDEIKRIRKEQTVDIKVDKEKLSALKTDRDRAYKVGALGPVESVWEV
jgi:DNA repair protein RAD50